MGCKMLTLSIRNGTKSKRSLQPEIDELLNSIGLIRHVVPRDGNSLFRCISQCVFYTQSYHITVRQHLLQFANLKTDEFNELTHVSVREYEKKITSTKLDGELLDMHIAARYYKINIFLYTDTNPFMPLIIETPNSAKTLLICVNPEGTYDLVFAKETVANMSFCQAIVYGMLYEQVFGLSNVDFAIKRMLSGRNFSSRINDRTSLKKRATCTDMKELIDLGITPFPFKVAKALTTFLYRNTEYDIWLNNKKEKFFGKWNNCEFKEGSKCMVSIDDYEYHCYIQHISSKNEPVEVYVKDLAEKIFVDFDQLKLIPVEEDMREMIESPEETDKVSSTNDGYSFSTVTEQCESPVYYNNNLVHRPAVYGALPSAVAGQMFSPTCYQQQPTFSMTPLNSNDRGSMHPWYMSTPPLLPNAYRPFKEQIVLPSNLHKNCVPTTNFLPHTFIDSSPKVNGIHVQPVPTPPWYYQPQNMSCCYMDCSNIEGSGVAMSCNHAYQPCLSPEFDKLASESQQ